MNNSILNTGTLLQMATLLVVLGITYSTLTHKTDAASQDIADHEQRLRVLENTVLKTLTRMEERLAVIERNTQ